MYRIDATLKKPLHIQLFEALKKDIIQNHKVGDKLSSIRKMASTYNLSKNTVESAYSQLVAEGYIDSVPQSGYVVTDTTLQNFQIQKDIEHTAEKKEEILYDFFPARLHKQDFPLKLWKRLYNKVITEDIDLGAYANPQGEYGLRVQIANYLSASRAVNCSENQIVLCNGFADAMGLTAMMLQEHHNTIAAESPGYHVLKKVFKHHRYEIEDLKLGEQGIEISQLSQIESKLLYVTPSHQYPTGVAMPIANRVKLLEWANSTNAYIIEDDYDSELSYITRPIPSLQGLDKNERVIYTGTFSKALSPAIRVTYMVLPQKLLERYNKAFLYHASRVCLTTQYTLEAFIKQGYWDKHIRKIRTLNKKKHNLMKQLLKEKLGNTMRIEAQGGGLAIHINPTVDFDWNNLKTLAEKKSIKLHFAKDRTDGQWQAIMMGFGGFTMEEIPHAIELFSKIWFECLKQNKAKSDTI